MHIYQCWAPLYHTGFYKIPRFWCSQMSLLFFCEWDNVPQTRYIPTPIYPLFLTRGQYTVFTIDERRQIALSAANPQFMLCDLTIVHLAIYNGTYVLVLIISKIIVVDFASLASYSDYQCNICVKSVITSMESTISIFKGFYRVFDHLVVLRSLSNVMSLEFRYCDMRNVRHIFTNLCPCDCLLCTELSWITLAS